MKYILLYSIKHTGTWFTAHLMEAAYGAEKTLIIMPGLIRDRNEEYKGISLQDLDYSGGLYNAFDKYVFSNITEEEKSQYELLVMQAHYELTGCKLVRSIEKSYPGFPVVIPIRDPMLCLCTRIWREFNLLDEYKTKLNEDYRKQFANNIVDKFIDILCMPNEHRFLFHIDALALKDENFRISQYEALFRFAGLPECDIAKKMIQDWKPINKTIDCFTESHDTMYHQSLKTAVEGYTGKENDGKIFELIKQEASIGRISLAREVLPIEMEILQNRRELKYLLKANGYTNLPWW